MLRFLQDKCFERIGETRTRKANVRVVAATNRDLETDVAAGRFREDLLFRLNVIEVRVPTLSQRQEDILPLARRFLAFFARAVGRALPTFSADAERVLAAYDWPGNVRELRNAVERAVILWPSAIIEPQAFPEKIAGSKDRGPYVGGRVHARRAGGGSRRRDLGARQDPGRRRACAGNRQLDTVAQTQAFRGP